MSSDVQHKLFNYSQTPPPSAWKGIADALDASPAYAQKLYHYEQEPPGAAWEKIAQQVMAPQGKVVSLRTKLFKYAIAAAVLLAIAAGSLFYLTNSNAPNLATQPEPPATDTKKSTLLNTELQPGSETVVWQKADEGKATDSITENNSTEGGLVSFSSRVRIVKKQRLPAREITVMPRGKNIIDTEKANRYMIATTSTGNAVRLPKKAYSDYACAEALNNHPCKERLAFIQSKMAASVATDFTDFVDLLKKLQEN